MSPLPVPLSCTTLLPKYWSSLPVSSCKINCPVPVPLSSVTPPFTTETFAAALPESKLTVSPTA